MSLRRLSHPLISFFFFPSCFFVLSVSAPVLHYIAVCQLFFFAAFPFFFFSFFFSRPLLVPFSFPLSSILEKHMWESQQTQATFPLSFVSNSWGPEQIRRKSSFFSRLQTLLI
ncbi:hypothetical protein DFJ73DRAFT_127366 [Zopfochytrium polystomum]|nr:hypothetical protein DFJ73DRAFT_127366 [Zopfochytrium polystomum]